MPEYLAKDENLLARLDRMPITKTTIGILILLALVWLAEAFDIGIVGTVITILKKSWDLSGSQQGLLGIASTLGVVLGMVPAGILADRFGRKRTVLLGIAFFSIITLLGAFVNNFAILIAIRFLAGIGEGAVLPMPYLFLSEFIRSKRRAVSVGYANGILTAAYLLPNLVGAYAISTFSADIAWRIPFLLGAIPLLLIFPLAKWLPESPRFLLKKGRHAEVERLIERLEKEANLHHDTTLINKRALVVIQKGANVQPAWSTLFQAPYLSRAVIATLQLTAALVLFYILQVFGPLLLINRGIGSSNSMIEIGLMMLTAGVGSIIQGYFADRYGRRITLMIYFALASFGSLLFALSTVTALTLLAAFLTSFFGLGVFPVSKLTVAEQYPTRLRGKGVYMDEMTARLVSGVVTIFFIPVLLASFGNTWIFVGIAFVLLVFSFPIVLFGRETANISVEEAGSDLSFERIDRELSLNDHQVTVLH
nr:MFS transporter [Bacilli bacterium]